VLRGVRNEGEASGECFLLTPFPPRIRLYSHPQDPALTPEVSLMNWSKEGTSGEGQTEPVASKEIKNKEHSPPPSSEAADPPPTSDAPSPAAAADPPAAASPSSHDPPFLQEGAEEGKKEETEIEAGAAPQPAAAAGGSGPVQLLSVRWEGVQEVDPEGRPGPTRRFTDSLLSAALSAPSTQAHRIAELTLHVDMEGGFTTRGLEHLGASPLRANLRSLEIDTLANPFVPNDPRPLLRPDLTPLASLAHLESLQLLAFLGLRGSDLTPLTALPNLRTLTLYIEDLDGIGCLAACPSLRVLILYDLYFDYAAADLALLTQLDTLVLLPPAYYTRIKDLYARTEMLFDTRGITDKGLSLLATSLPNLERLGITRARGVTLEGLESLALAPRLRNLTLGHMDISSFPGGLPRTLQVLALAIPAMEDLSISRVPVLRHGDLDSLLDGSMPDLRVLILGCDELQCSVSYLREVAAAVAVARRRARVAARHRRSSEGAAASGSSVPVEAATAAEREAEEETIEAEAAAEGEAAATDGQPPLFRLVILLPDAVLIKATKGGRLGGATAEGGTVEFASLSSNEAHGPAE
jgi:hypothetical protein